MRAAILYTLVHTCTLFSFGFSQIKQYYENLQAPLQCTEGFHSSCADQNVLDRESVQFRFCLPPTDPELPPNNHRQCYSTCTFLDNQDPICVQCKADESMDGALPVTTRTDVYSIYRLRSPGFGIYLSNIICDYRVQCGADQSLMIQIITHELEPIRDDGLCPDALSIFKTNDPFFSGPTCGMELPDRSVFFSLEPLSANFASNGETGSGGFFAFAFCVNDDFLDDQPDQCEHFDRRRKRSDEDSDRGKRSFRTPHFTVKPGQVVRYTDYTVTVERVSDGKILHKFENIRVLQTYNQFESFVTYKETAGNRTFPGFGKLRIGYGIVQYTQFDINPRFIPSAEETRRISYLVGNLTAAGFFNNETFSVIIPGSPVGQPGFPPPCPNLNASGLMQIAMESINSCNGFLRAAADFFMELTEMCNFPPVL